MRNPGPQVKAAKRTVRLTLSSDLHAQAKKLGIDASQVAEDALAQEITRRRAAVVRAEVLQDLAAAGAYAAKHGSFAEMAREHFGHADDEV